MKVTTKGQVTIPQHIRDKYGININTEVDFVDEDGKIILVKKRSTAPKNRFKKFRRTATVKMTTDEIMALTRGSK